jgi:hypothetical protein
MGSPLDFISSDGFRKKLITRNLTPYAKSPSRPTLPIDTDTCFPLATFLGRFVIPFVMFVFV